MYQLVMMSLPGPVKPLLSLFRSLQERLRLHQPERSAPLEVQEFEGLLLPEADLLTLLRVPLSVFAQGFWPELPEAV